MSEVDTELINAAVMKKKLSKPVKITLIIVVLLAAGMGGYFAYQSYNKQETKYLTMTASKGSIVNEIEATGTITPLHEIDLYFKDQGTLEELNVSSGDSVEKGEVLAVQDDSTLQAEVQQCQSDVEQAQLNLEKAQNDYNKSKTTADRQEALYNQGAISKSDLEDAVNSLDSAEVSVRLNKVSISNAQAKLVIAQTNLDNATLTAPFSGVVSEVNGEVGQDTGNSSSGLLHLISSDLQIKVNVNEADIGSIKEGQEVDFTVTSFPNKTFKGTVEKISQQATTTNNVQQFEVDVATSGLSSQLKAGMSVSAKIIIEKQENVITVPNLALTYAQTFAKTSKQSAAKSAAGTGTRKAASQQGISQGTQNASAASNTETKQVVILKNGKPVVKQITLGLSDGTNTEVKSGLSAGEKVVIGTNDSTQSSSSGSSSSGNSSSNSSRNKSNSGGGGMPGGGGGPMP